MEFEEKCSELRLCEMVTSAIEFYFARYKAYHVFIKIFASCAFIHFTLMFLFSIFFVPEIIWLIVFMQLLVLFMFALESKRLVTKISKFNVRSRFKNSEILESNTKYKIENNTKK